MNSRFQKILESLNMRKKDMAVALGLTPAAVSDIIHNRVKNISGPILELLKIKFNVNPIWLLTGEGEMFLPGKDPRRYSGDDNLNVVSGSAEEYPDIDIITKIANTGWWKHLTETEREIVVFMANLKDADAKKKVRDLLEACVKKEIVEDELAMKVQSLETELRQKGAAG